MCIGTAIYGFTRHCITAGASVGTGMIVAKIIGNRAKELVNFYPREIIFLSIFTTSVAFLIGRSLSNYLITPENCSWFIFRAPFQLTIELASGMAISWLAYTYLFPLGFKRA